MDLQIIKIASENKNQRYLKNYTHRIKSKNSLCGDEITLSLLLKNEVIKEVGYECKSCVFCQASINLLTKKIIEMNANNIIDLCNQVIDFYEKKEGKIVKNLSSFKKIFTKENVSRKECLLLPFKTLRKVLISKNGKV